MLNAAKSVKGYSLHCIDGEIGKIKEFYFDDLHWTIRYLVADTGGWLPGREVLISPYALGAMHKETQRVTVNLTKKQIEDSPALDSDKPVSRQFEDSYYGFHGWPSYYDGPLMWGSYPGIVRDSAKWTNPTRIEKEGNPHLRNTQVVTGYHIHATDGEVGHVEDFIIDDETWAIRYLVVGTKNWWPGKKVLVSPKWIKRVSWAESKVFVDLSRAQIKQSPEYPGEFLISRDYENGLHHHYQRQGYWVEELVAQGHPR
jgi:sporulation protein YlmC with PRC-barrel domain